MTLDAHTADSRTDFYCPVCGKTIVFMWIWQNPESSRIRMFCEECAQLEEYRELSKTERVIYSFEGFQRFAGRRLLAHVREREVAKQRGEPDSHTD